MTFIEPLELPAPYLIELELNRLAGTLIYDKPTLGKASAALRWLGHGELAWATHNNLPVNVATGGSTYESTEGFEPLDGQEMEVIEGDALLGNTFVQVTPSAATARSFAEDIILSAVGFADRQPVEPWRIYTASIYTRMGLGSITPSRPNQMSIIWFDAEGNEIMEHVGGAHASKQEWGVTWVTSYAPETAAEAYVQIEWQQKPGEYFHLDKAIFYNGTDPQAWAFPGAGSFDLDTALRAHLNMKAGIFDPEGFLSIEEICNRLAGISGADPARALHMIQTPDPLVFPH